MATCALHSRPFEVGISRLDMEPVLFMVLFLVKEEQVTRDSHSG